MRSNRINLPVVWVLLFALMMGAVDVVTDSGDFDFPFRSALAAAILMCGFSIIGAGGLAFRRAGTTIDPQRPERVTRLVTSGLYAVSRNPMYAGFFAWLLAGAIATGNVLNFALLPVFVALMNKMYIVPEERALGDLFGNDFVAYRAAVRRWI